MGDRPTDPVIAWLRDAESRHLSALRFPEVRRALQSLSAWYVERRSRFQPEVALDGAGKRAAFALFYGPLHFAVVSHLVRALSACDPPLRRILDLGCGTGAAGAAWALESGGAVLTGIDRHTWAVEETRRTWRALGLEGKSRRGDLARQRLPGAGNAILAAYTVNELPCGDRAGLLQQLRGAAGRGARVLIVEPVARRALDWWEEWRAAFEADGGRADTWRFEAELPEITSRLDRAAGLDHRELTARSLYLPA